MCKGRSKDTRERNSGENFDVMYTPGGVKYRVVDVAGGGLCGLLAPIALNLFATGFPVEEIVSAVKDNITDDMEVYALTLRGELVETSRDHFTFVDDMPEYELTPGGEEFADLADIICNPAYVILTRALWERVMLFPTGYLDGKAVWLVGQVLDLDGLRIVKHVDGCLFPADANGDLPVEHCPMVMHDGLGHFKALLPVSGNTDGESRASGGTNGEPEASSGTDEESDASGGTDEKSEASGGTDGEESGDTPMRYHDWSDDEYYGDDETWLHQTGQEWDGWSLVGKKGVARTRSETRQVFPRVRKL